MSQAFKEPKHRIVLNSPEAGQPTNRRGGSEDAGSNGSGANVDVIVDSKVVTENAGSSSAQGEAWHPSTPLSTPGLNFQTAAPQQLKDETSQLTQLQQLPVAAAESTSPSAQGAQPFQPQNSPAAVHLSGSLATQRADLEAAAAAARERDVAAAFAALPCVRPRWTHNYMKILVVGDDGLGKTTSVRNLFAAYASDAHFPVADASAEGSDAVFRDSPDRLCTELVVRDEDAKIWWHYLVQDTPGYGDFDGPDDAEAQRSAVLDHIRACSASYFEAESDGERQAPLFEAADCRVDVCLYFLPPHRLRRTDVRFMRQLAELVPVVPLLAKADTMTGEELKAYRAVVHGVLTRCGTAWQFNGDALQEVGAPQGPPFAVVSSNTVDRHVGRFWPVRRYPWGQCEPLLTAHSELPLVRRLLFEAAYWDIKANTEAQYLQYRQRECADRSNPVPRAVRGLSHLVAGVATITVAAFAAANLAPVVKDEVVRKETVRRVKAKVDDVVDSAAGVAQDVKAKVEDKAVEASHVARATAAAAVDTTKKAGKRWGRRAAEALQTEDVKAAKQEAERIKAENAGHVPSWQFWRHGGGLE